MFKKKTKKESFRYLCNTGFFKSVSMSKTLGYLAA